MAKLLSNQPFFQDIRTKEKPVIGPNNNFLQLEIKSIKKHMLDLAFVANNKFSIKGTFFAYFSELCILVLYHILNAVLIDYWLLSHFEKYQLLAFSEQKCIFLPGQKRHIANIPFCKQHLWAPD